MGHIILTSFAFAFLTFVVLYLRIVYESVRKVKIVKTQRSALKKKTPNKLIPNNCVAETNVHVKKLRQAPGPMPWPILGNLQLLAGYDVPFQGFTELAKQFGDVYSLTLGTTRCLIVNNLDLIREVLNQNGKCFGGRPDFLRFHVLFGGDRNNSLALCDWSQLQQKRRNLARKHCSPRDKTSFFTKMSDVGCSEMLELMSRLSTNVTPGEEFALKPFLQQTCANMFCRYMCSVRFDYDDIEFQSIVRCFDEIFWDINQGYPVDFLPWLSPFYYRHFKRITFWSETIRKFILERIINEREQSIDDSEMEKDFTDAILKSLADDKEVSRETIIFMLEDFIGGHSAIGNLVMLALAYIIRNPLVGKNIQEEIDTTVGCESRIITLSDAEKMPYTLATIYEVLRYSSSPIVPHVATEDVAIAGYGVSKGTIVFINNYELNTSAKYWTSPEDFNPERFLEPIKTGHFRQREHCQEGFRLKNNIQHFLPFSVGKRTCIGQNLVKCFGFIMLANILKAYNVGCKDISKIKIFPACIAVPYNTFKVTLTPRKENKTIAAQTIHKITKS